MLILALAVLAVVLVVAWRAPVVMVGLGIAASALRPDLLMEPEAARSELWLNAALYFWSIPHTLILLGLLGGAVRLGLRFPLNWPLLAFTVVLVLSSVLGDPHPRLSVAFMLACFGVMTLPWLFPQVAFRPLHRDAMGWLIALLPLLSTIGAGVVGALETGSLTAASPLLRGWVDYLSGDREQFWFVFTRLEGLTANAAAFAALALAGFLAAAHQWVLTRHSAMGVLAAANLALVILSGTRMAIIAAAVFAIAYVALAPEARELIRLRARAVAAGVIGVGVVLVLYLPVLEMRMFWGGEGVNLSVRDEIWPFYLRELAYSPWFGRGFGSGFVAIADHVRWPRKTPHNEFLHLLVTGGIVGLALSGAAIVAWFRRLHAMARGLDRPYVLAAAAALATFALTDDALVLTSGLAFWAYLGLVPSQPARSVAPLPALPRRRSRSAAW
jgi:hypothetical protein